MLLLSLFRVTILVRSQVKLYTFTASLTWKLDEEENSSGLWTVYAFSDPSLQSTFTSLVFDNALLKASKTSTKAEITSTSSSLSSMTAFVSDPAVLALVGFSLSNGQTHS